MPTSHSYHIAPPKPFAAPPDPATGGTAPAGVTINASLKNPSPLFNPSAQAQLFPLPVFDPTGTKKHPGTQFGSKPVEVAPGGELPGLNPLWFKNHPGGLTGIPLFAAGSQDQYQQLNPMIGDQRPGVKDTTIDSLRQDLPTQVQAAPAKNFMGPQRPVIMPFLSPFGPAK